MKPKRTGTRLLPAMLLVALGAAPHLSCAIHHGAETLPDGPVAPALPAAALARLEREAILDLVGRHRRGASETWHGVLTDAIYDEARNADVDPLMVASIVALESSFRSRAVSPAGAVGLMQLRPFVARDVARRGAQEWNGIETLRSPELNLRLGILYYKELVERFDGDVEKVLTAYNQGPTRVSRQVRDGSYEGSRYASDVMSLYATLDTARDTWQ